MMEYAVGIYNNSPEFMADELQAMINLLSESRWTVDKVWLTYRETKVVILYRRMRIESIR